MSGEQLLLTFELVNLGEMWRYTNADPRFYSNTTQTTPNSQIPDEHWHTVECPPRDREAVIAQAQKLREWSDADREYVRNVHVSRVTQTMEDLDLDQLLREQATHA